MKSSILGLIAGIFIVGYAVNQTSDDFASYLNFLSVLIVFGGTVSAAIITHGFKKIFQIVAMFFKAFKTSEYNNVKIVKELVGIATEVERGKSIENLNKKGFHPYTQDGLRLIENRMDTDKILKISKNMLYERHHHYQNTVEQLEVLAKYPPAFGMMGTIIGLIAVMKKLGADTGLDSVGPSMAVALITTLYGIFIANYIINPISDNLTARSKKDLQVRKIISEGILLINDRENSVYVRESLLSFLLPHERDQVLRELGRSPQLKKVA